MTRKPLPVSRRHVLATMGSALAASATVSPRPALAAPNPQRRYLFVLSAFGGASLVDSFLPIPASTSRRAATLTTFADSLVDTVGNLRCVQPLTEEAARDPQRPPVGYAQKTFLQHHGADVAVVTMEHSSVSHPTAQLRAMNGGGSADRGRTILETVAEVHGVGLPLPIVNMTSGGFVVAGTDPGLPTPLRQVAVVDPKSFALGTHGSTALVRPIDEALVRRARLARQKAQAASLFSTRHSTSQSLRAWAELQQRAGTVEAADLVAKLMLVGLPGVPVSADIAQVKQRLPSLEYDVMEAEAALAFLLAKNGVSSSIAFGSLSMATRELIDGVVTPLVYPNQGFDFAHTSHRIAQSSCWSRVLRVADGLIRLLKETEDPERPGTSMWSHSLMFVTTDFGRDKVRNRDSLSFGSGHHLNNGCLVISPLVHGNRVFGGVDPETALTYGFEPSTGAPAPGRLMTEAEIFGGVAQALGVSFPGRLDLPALVKG